jgi:hypothetical protein
MSQVLNHSDHKSVIGILAIAVAGSFLTSGCALLTKSEVQEVKAFANATKNYGTLPGGAIKAYGDISRNDRELEASARTFKSGKIAEQVRTNLEKSREADQAFAAAAERADKALSVLNTYSDCLSALSSDTYTDDLGQSASNLGKSLDQAVGAYNKSFGGNFGTFGAIVAGAIRAGGGIYIRHKQVTYLRDFIAAADAKMIPALTRDIRNLMQNNVRPNLTALKTRLDQDFDIAATHGETLPLETIHTINEWYDDLKKADQLAAAATTSANTYRVAHAKLAAAFAKKTDLQGVSDEIQTLIAEIKAAQKIKDDLTTK